MTGAQEGIDAEERAFYVDVLRGRVVVVAATVPGVVEECREVGAAMAAVGVQSVVVVPGERSSPVVGSDVVSTWRDLAAGGSSELAHAEPVEAAATIAIGGRAHKLVVVGDDLVVHGPGGERRSFIDVGLAGLPASVSRVARPLYEGVDGVNLVAPGGLAGDLLTYTGTGTLLSLGDYGEIRRLGFSDFARVAALLQRGGDLGFLRPRAPAEIEELLPRALGFFVSGTPGGVVALDAVTYSGTGLGELEALFTIDRFQGEGVGRRLVEALDDFALALGLDGLFAVTTRSEAADFFATCGYTEVDPAAVPAAKWAGYPPERRSAVTCLLRTW